MKSKKLLKKAKKIIDKKLLSKINKIKNEKDFSETSEYVIIKSLEENLEKFKDRIKCIKDSFFLEIKIMKLKQKINIFKIERTYENLNKALILVKELEKETC